MTALDSYPPDVSVSVSSTNLSDCLMPISMVQTTPPSTVEVPLSSCTTGGSLRTRQSQQHPRLKMQHASDPGEAQSVCLHSPQHDILTANSVPIDAQSTIASSVTILPNAEPVWTLQRANRSASVAIPSVSTAASSSHHPAGTSEACRRTSSDAVVSVENAEVLHTSFFVYRR